MSPSPVERIRVWHSQGDTKPKKASELSSPGAKGLGVCITGEGRGGEWGLASRLNRLPGLFFTVGCGLSSVYVLKVKAFGQLRQVWCNCRLVARRSSWAPSKPCMKQAHCLPFSSVVLLNRYAQSPPRTDLSAILFLVGEP